jgi:cytochrome c oxidase assembly factor CtaG
MHTASHSTEPAPQLDARSALRAWEVPPALVVALVLTAVLYGRGWRRLDARRPGRVSVGRLGAFVAGLVMLFVALASPLDTLADRSLPIHMAQHLVLLVVVPPLLLAAAPIVPLLHGLPAGIARTALGAVASLVERIAHPIVGLAALSLAVWGWHVPAAFELALRERVWHLAEHASFLAAGLLFWWPVVHPWPSRARWPRWAIVPYLLLADVQNTALSALLIFSERVFYPTYGIGPAALESQALAGLLMWVPMSFAYLVPAAVVTWRLLAPRKRDEGRPFGPPLEALR